MGLKPPQNNSASTTSSTRAHAYRRFLGELRFASRMRAHVLARGYTRSTTRTLRKHCVSVLGPRDTSFG